MDLTLPKAGWRVGRKRRLAIPRLIFNEIKLLFNFSWFVYRVSRIQKRLPIAGYEKVVRYSVLETCRCIPRPVYVAAA